MCIKSVHHICIKVKIGKIVFKIYIFFDHRVPLCRELLFKPNLELSGLLQLMQHQLRAVSFSAKNHNSTLVILPLIV